MASHDEELIRDARNDALLRGNNLAADRFRNSEERLFIYKLYSWVHGPFKTYQGCFDIFSPQDILFIPPGDCMRISCGFALTIPKGYLPLIPNYYLCDDVYVTETENGVCENEEISLMLYNHSTTPFTLGPRWKIAVMWLIIHADLPFTMITMD